jgi:hypothetical protein
VAPAVVVLSSTGALVGVTTSAVGRTPGAPADSDRYNDCLNEDLRAVTAARAATAELVDLAGLMCPDQQCIVERDGVLVRPDGLHFNSDGDPWVGRWLFDRMLEPGLLARHSLRG